MEYRRETIANVNYGSVKTAALFFDHVIPLSPRGLGNELDNKGLSSLEEYESVLYSLLPNDLTKGGLHHEYYRKVLNESESLRRTAKHYMKLGMYLDEACLEEGRDLRADFKIATKHLKSISESYKNSTQIEYQSSQGDKFKEGDDVIISLMNLNLIDVRNTTWEQILEFRKDEISLKNFRRLKLFLYDNYKDKPASYIEDDILKRIEDYNNSVSKWGFNTRISTLESILSSKGLYASSSIAMISAFCEMPSLAFFSGGSAATVALGKIGLKLVKAKREKIELRKESPLAYVIIAQEKLEN